MFRIAHVALVAAFLLLSAPPAPPADPAGEEPFAGTRTGGPWLGTEDRVLAGRDEPRPAASVTLAVGADLTALHVEPTVGRAFAADATSARLVVVDVAGASIIGEIPVRAGPSAIAATWDGAWLFVGHTGNRSILVVNPATLQVERVIDTTFYVRSLVSPQPDFLVATVHDPAGVGDFPYVIRVSDEVVVQRLNGGLGLSEFDYRDAIVSVTNDAGRLYVMNTGPGGVIVQSFGVADYAAGTWWFLQASPAAQLGTGGREVFGFGSSAPAYVARASGPLLELNPTTLAPVRTIGTSSASATGIVSPWGRVAYSAGDEAFHMFVGGTSLGNLSAGGPIEVLRAPWIPDRFVAIVGSGSTQDVAIGATTGVVPLAPFGYFATSLPGIAADVPSLLETPTQYLAVTVDGIPAENDPYLTDRWTGRPAVPLSDGVHTAKMRLVGVPFPDSVEWNFTVDTTPPWIEIPPPQPFTSETADLVVSGIVTDLTPVTLTVDGRAVPVEGGRFTANVTLAPGINYIAFVARDAAGNEAPLWLPVIYTALGDWFPHPAHRFRIRPPLGWTVEGNATVGDGVADLVALDSASGSSLVVVSEARTLQGTHAEARAILQEAVDNVSGLPGFYVMVPMSDIEVFGLPGARIVVRVGAGTSPVQQTMVVLVGASEGRFWALATTTAEGSRIQYWTDASIQSFETLEAGPSIRPGGPSSLETWLVLGIVAAVAASALLLAVLWRRRRRRDGGGMSRPPT